MASSSNDLSVTLHLDHEATRIGNYAMINRPVVGARPPGQPPLMAPQPTSLTHSLGEVGEAATVVMRNRAQQRVRHVLPTPAEIRTALGDKDTENGGAPNKLNARVGVVDYPSDAVFVPFPLRPPQNLDPAAVSKEGQLNARQTTQWLLHEAFDVRGLYAQLPTAIRQGTDVSGSGGVDDGLPKFRMPQVPSLGGQQANPAPQQQASAPQAAQQQQEASDEKEKEEPVRRRQGRDFALRPPLAGEQGLSDVEGLRLAFDRLRRCLLERGVGGNGKTPHRPLVNADGAPISVVLQRCTLDELAAEVSCENQRVTVTATRCSGEDMNFTIAVVDASKGTLLPTNATDWSECLASAITKASRRRHRQSTMRLIARVPVPADVADVAFDADGLLVEALLGTTPVVKTGASKKARRDTR